jgi:WD40 repeat protein
MNLQRFINIISSSKNVVVGLGLTMLAVTANHPVRGLPQQKLLFNQVLPNTAPVMTGNSQQPKARTNKEKIILTGHSGGVRHAVWSPDRKIIASGSEDKTIKLWDTTTGKIIKTLAGNNGEIDSLAWNRDGKTLAAANGNQISIWNISTGKLIKNLFSVRVNLIAWSADGKTLAAVERNAIQLWDTTTGKLIKTLPGHSMSVRGLAWSMDGNILASAGDGDNIIKLWDKTTGNLIKILTGSGATSNGIDGNNGNILNAIAWSQDDKFIATTDIEKTIQLWDVTTGKFIKSLAGHDGTILGIVWYSNGKTLASVSQDKTVKLWDISTGKVIDNIRINLPVALGVAWSGDGRKLAVGEWSLTPSIKIWDVNFKN